jgi:hypothetical protein
VLSVIKVGVILLNVAAPQFYSLDNFISEFLSVSSLPLIKWNGAKTFVRFLTWSNVSFSRKVLKPLPKTEKKMISTLLNYA